MLLLRVAVILTAVLLCYPIDVDMLAWGRRNDVLAKQLGDLEAELRLHETFDGRVDASNLAFQMERMDLSSAHLDRAWELLNHSSEAQLRLVSAALRLPSFVLNSTNALRAQTNLRAQLVRFVSSNELKAIQPVSKQVDVLGRWYFQLLMTLAYQGPAYNPARDLSLLSQVARRLAPALLARDTAALQISPTLRRQIKVGFLSVFMKEHSIGKVLGPVIATLGSVASNFHVTMYTMDQEGLDPTHHAKETKATEFFANYVKKFGGEHVHLSQDPEKAKHRIQQDQLDVLVFAEVGEDAWTYVFPHYRLACVQVAFWGHGTSTGLPNIDYYITSELFPPKPSYYTEQLVQFETLSMLPMFPQHLLSDLKVQSAIANPSSHRSHFGFAAHDHLYLFAHNPMKLAVPSFDRAIFQLLCKDKRAKLIIKHTSTDKQAEAEAMEVLWHRWGRHSSSCSHSNAQLIQRIVTLPRQETAELLYQLYAVVDVLLDPFPYESGVVTNLDAFAVGTPVVTLPSESSNMACTAGFYKRMGVNGLVATSVENYVSIAVHLASDLGLDGQKQLREMIRSQAQAALFDNEDTIHEWAEFLQKASHCEHNKLMAL